MMQIKPFAHALQNDRLVIQEAASRYYRNRHNLMRKVDIDKLNRTLFAHRLEWLISVFYLNDTIKQKNNKAF
jgi:hypothetical protein